MSLMLCYLIGRWCFCVCLCLGVCVCVGGVCVQMCKRNTGKHNLALWRNCCEYVGSSLAEFDEKIVAMVMFVQ